MMGSSETRLIEKIVLGAQEQVFSDSLALYKNGELTPFIHSWIRTPKTPFGTASHNSHQESGGGSCAK
jgi:hypothetical protein